MTATLRERFEIEAVRYLLAVHPGLVLHPDHTLRYPIRKATARQLAIADKRANDLYLRIPKKDREVAMDAAISSAQWVFVDLMLGAGFKGDGWEWEWFDDLATENRKRISQA